VAFEPDHRKLPDGTVLYETFWAAKRLGVTPPSVPPIAERHNVARYAGRARGGITHYYEAEGIERARAERDGIVPFIADSDELVPLPFTPKKRG